MAFFFCRRSCSFSPSKRPVDRASPPRTLDNPRPTAQLFLKAWRLAAFHGHVHSAGDGAVRHFRELANVLKLPAETCRVAGRDREPGCRPAPGARESAGVWDRQAPQKFGPKFAKNT